MPPTNLVDPTVWRWDFFAQTHGRDGADHIHERHWKEFRTALLEGARWTGGQPDDLRALSEPPPASRQTSVRFAKMPWQEAEGRLRTLEARALLDVWYIESGHAMRGAAGAESFEALRAGMWHPDTQAHPLLGQVVCFAAEEPDATAASIASRLQASQAGELDVVEFPWGGLGLPQKPGQPLLLLCRRGTEEMERVANLVHRILPQLLLAQMKIRGTFEQLEQVVLPKAWEAERKLNAELVRCASRPLRLNSLEESSDVITRKQRELAESLSECEELCHTAVVNVDNLDRLAADPILEGDRSHLLSVLVEPARLWAEQISSDIRYLRITEHQADRTLTSISTMAQIRSSRWQRRTTVLISVFVVFGVVQAFPELRLPWRFGVLLIGALAIFGLIALLSREH